MRKKKYKYIVIQSWLPIMCVSWKLVYCCCFSLKNRQFTSNNTNLSSSYFLCSRILHTSQVPCVHQQAFTPVLIKGVHNKPSHLPVCVRKSSIDTVSLYWMEVLFTFLKTTCFCLIFRLEHWATLNDYVTDYPWTDYKGNSNSEGTPVCTFQLTEDYLFLSHSETCGITPGNYIREYPSTDL